MTASTGLAHALSACDLTQILTESGQNITFVSQIPLHFLSSIFIRIVIRGASLLWFNPFRLSYVYIRTKFPNRCDSCTYIYVHGLCDRKMGLLTDTLRYHHTVHTRCSRASGLQLAAILQHVYQRKKSGVYSELSAVFGKFWKITIVGPSSIHRLVWNTTAHYMDFLP